MPGQAAGSLQGGGGKHHLRGGDAVHGHTAALLLAGVDRRREIVQIRQRRFIQQQLVFTALPPRVVCEGQRGAAHESNALLQFSAVLTCGDNPFGAVVVARGGIGDASYTVCRQLTGHGAEVGCGVAEPGAQPRIQSEQASVRHAAGVAFDAGLVCVSDLQGPACRTVQHPQFAAGVLNPHWPIGQPAVELLAVEITGDVLVILHAAQPAGSWRLLQRTCQAGGVADRGWRAVDRCPRRRPGKQVNVMIVQAGQQRAAARIEYLFARFSAKVRRQRHDASAFDAQIGECASPVGLNRLGTLDQHAEWPRVRRPRVSG